MGAEAWIAIAPFGDDAEEVLRNLQASIFKDICSATFDDEAMPKSIAAYRRQHGEDGTRSVLDVRGIADEPGVGYAGPLPRELLMRVLKTVRPTRAMVIGAKSELMEGLGRGEAAYVVCWADGRPTEVVFIGWSYD